MALPSSPPITLGQVYAEFGAPAGTNLGAFLRGGSYVSNTPGNANVPASLPISLGQLCGASAQAVAISDDTIQALSIAPTDATATYTLNANGLIQGTRNGSTSTEGTWLIGGAASDFYVVATLQSGSLDGGSGTGTQLNLGTSRSWTRTRTENTSGTSQAVLLLQIYDVATNTLLDSATITLQATVDI